jgi:hypothetical protein
MREGTWAELLKLEIIFYEALALEAKHGQEVFLPNSRLEHVGLMDLGFHVSPLEDLLLISNAKGTLWTVPLL